MQTDVTMKVGSLNVRSIRKPAKQKQLLEFFVNSDLDVLNIQETWMDAAFLIPEEYRKKVRIMHTLPKDSRGEGMMTMTKHKDMNIQSSMELLWAPWLMVTVIHKAIKNIHRAVGAELRKVVCVNFYRPPKERQNALNHLRFIISSIKERHKTNCIIVSGDFNLNPKQVEEFVKRTPLTMIEPQGWEGFTTRKQRKG